MVNIAVIGVGRVGLAVASLLLLERFVDSLLIVDIARDVLRAAEEELRHVAAATSADVKFSFMEDSSELSECDIIVVTAGRPRTSEKSRRELAGTNAKIIKSIATSTKDKNPDATYIVVTNPVEVMAYLMWSMLREARVIGTGTWVDTIRLRAYISKRLGVPVSHICGYVIGEHGERPIILSETLTIKGRKIGAYVRDCREFLNKIREYLTEVSKVVIKGRGGTEFCPAFATVDIIRAIALREGQLLTVSYPEELAASYTYVVGAEIRGMCMATEDELKQLMVISNDIQRAACGLI